MHHTMNFLLVIRNNGIQQEHKFRYHNKFQALAILHMNIHMNTHTYSESERGLPEDSNEAFNSELSPTRRIWIIMDCRMASYIFSMNNDQVWLT